MKARDVMSKLQISRPTLYRWVKSGIIKTTRKPSGQLDYDAESVYALLNKGSNRGVYLYGRVSTNKQKADLNNQMQTLEQFAMTNGYQIAGAFKDVASGISFEKRKEFFKLLDLVIDNKVSKVIITYKDRLSRVGFDLFKHLFSKYDVEIIVISELNNEKTDEQEIFEEIVSLLHAFSIRMYSSRKKKLKEVILDDTKQDDD